MGTEFRAVLRRPEAELLLSCARSRMEPDRALRVRQVLKERIDWSYLIQEALYHGVIPLLFWNLTRVTSNGVPKETLGQIKNTFNVIARWNLCLTGELLKLLNLFRDVGIRALPFKGPVLAAAAYGNLSLRHFSDLDILVPKEDMLKAKEVLILRGYQPKLKLSASQETAYLRSHHDYKFIRSRDGVVVEIQWGVTERLFAFPFAFDNIWERRETVPVAGVSVANLSPEDLLLILCVHGAKHRWGQLKWICDIAELVDAYRERIDWNRLTVVARTLRGERMLLLGLFLAEHLLGAVLPPQALNRMKKEHQVELLAHQVNERLFDGFSKPLRLCDEAPFFYCKIRERLSDKWVLFCRYFPEYLLRIIIPNKRDRAFLQLPSFLSIGYYIIRPVRLVWEHSWDVLHHPPRTK